MHLIRALHGLPFEPVFDTFLVRVQDSHISNSRLSAITAIPAIKP